MAIAHNINDKLRTDDVLTSENVDFSGLLLSDYVMKGLANSGFITPSPIQLKAIPLGRCGLDLIVQAKSGTGKTCVFTVIALESLQLESSAVQVLVLAPTREIAIQIWDVIRNIGSAMPSMNCHTFIGGMPVPEDIQKLKLCHIAVGTPGRIKQLIENGIMKVDSVRLLVLDEADKLLEESFQDQINWIYSSLPENKQMLALSATYPEYLAKRLVVYMRNPTFLRLNVTDPALLGIEQFVKLVPHHPLPNRTFDEKIKVVTKLLSSVDFHQCLIFSNLQTRAENLAGALISQGWPTACIAGSYDQIERNDAMAKLKTYKCRVLISTDLTSRGIDAERVNLVINLDVPKSHETYLHRVGRAGRFGTFGASVTIVSEGQEQVDLQSLEKKCNTSIQPLPEHFPVDLCKSATPAYLNDLVSVEKINTSTNSDKISGDALTKNSQMYTEKYIDSENKENITPAISEQTIKINGIGETSCIEKNCREKGEKNKFDECSENNSDKGNTNKNDFGDSYDSVPSTLPDYKDRTKFVDESIELIGQIPCVYEDNKRLDSTKPCVPDKGNNDVLSVAKTEREKINSPMETFQKITTTTKSSPCVKIPSFSATINHMKLPSSNTYDTLTKDYEDFLESTEEREEIQVSLPQTKNLFSEERQRSVQQISELLDNIHERRAQNKARVMQELGESNIVNEQLCTEDTSNTVSNTLLKTSNETVSSNPVNCKQMQNVSDTNRYFHNEMGNQKPENNGNKSIKIEKKTKKTGSREQRNSTFQTNNNPKQKVINSKESDAAGEKCSVKASLDHQRKICRNHKQNTKSNEFVEDSTVSSKNKQPRKKDAYKYKLENVLNNSDDRKSGQLPEDKYQACEDYVYSLKRNSFSNAQRMVNNKKSEIKNISQTNPYPYGNPRDFQQNGASCDDGSDTHENNTQFGNSGIQSSQVVDYWNIPVNSYYYNYFSPYPDYGSYNQFLYSYPGHYCSQSVSLSEHMKMFHKMKIQFDSHCQYIQMMLN